MELPFEILCNICSYVADTVTYSKLEEVAKGNKAFANAIRKCFSRVEQVKLETVGLTVIKVSINTNGRFGSEEYFILDDKAPSEALKKFQLILKRSSCLRKICIDFGEEYDFSMTKSVLDSLKPTGNLMDLSISFLNLGDNHNVINGLSTSMFWLKFDPLMSEVVGKYDQLRFLTLEGIWISDSSKPERYDSLEIIPVISCLENLKLFTLDWSKVNWEKREVEISTYTWKRIIKPWLLFPKLKAEIPKACPRNFERVSLLSYSPSLPNGFDIFEWFPHVGHLEMKCQLTSVFQNALDLSESNYLSIRGVISDFFSRFGQSDTERNLRVNLVAEAGIIFKERDKLQVYVDTWVNNYNGGLELSTVGDANLDSSSYLRPISREALIRGEVIESFWVASLRNASVTINFRFDGE